MDLKWLIHDKLNITLLFKFKTYCYIIETCMNSCGNDILWQCINRLTNRTIWIPTSTYFFFKQWTTKVRPYHSSGIEGYNHNVLSINDQKYAYVRTE